MSDEPLPDDGEDQIYDYAHIMRPSKIRLRRSKEPDNRRTAWLAVGSLALQLGAIAWMGGRLEQRVTEQGTRLDQQAADIKEAGRDLSKQASTISAANATYAQILSRLDASDARATRIETKIDDLGNRR